MKIRKEIKSNTTLRQNHEPNQTRENDIPLGNIPNFVNVNDIDVPIALRKEEISCTKHPIERFVSHVKLSQKIIRHLWQLLATQIF